MTPRNVYDDDYERWDREHGLSWASIGAHATGPDRDPLDDLDPDDAALHIHWNEDRR